MPNKDWSLTNAEIATKNALANAANLKAKVSAPVAPPATPTTPVALTPNQIATQNSTTWSSVNAQGITVYNPLTPSTPASTGGSVNTPTNTNTATVPTSSPINNTPANLTNWSKSDSSGNIIAAPTTTDSVSLQQAIDNSPGILTYDELPESLKTYYDNNPSAKAQFDLTGTYWKQQQIEILKKDEAAAVESKKVQDYNAKQAANSTAQNSINQNQNIRNAQDTQNKAIANTYYSAVSPVSSGWQQTAAQGQLREIATKIDDMVQLYGLQNDAYAAQTAEQARRIQQELDDKLGKTLSDKLGAFDNGVANGTIATEDQLYDLFKQSSKAILKENDQLSNFAYQQMNDLWTGFSNNQKDLINRQDTFNKWANIYNVDMSQVQGFAVDGNGNPILSASGQKINTPKDAPLKPVYDDKTGTITTFTTNKNGTIIGNQQTVQWFQTPQPTDWIQRNNADGSTTLYSPSTKQTQNIPAPWQIASNNTGGTSSISFTPPYGFESDAARKSFWITQTQNGIQVDAAVGTVLGECWAFTNDIMDQVAGWKHVGNTWQSKLANDNSDTPVAGGAFMYNPSQSPTEKYGHVGIVESVNPDGSFVAYDSNIHGDEKSNRRTIKPWDKEYTLIQKDGGFFDPTKSSQTWKSQYSDTQKNLMDLYAGKPLTADQTKILASNGISTSTYANYTAGKNNAPSSADDATAQLIANYQLNPTQLNVLRKDPEKWQSILNKVTEINPNFSDADYANNLKTITQYWPSGKIGLSLKSLNTVMGHLGSYLDKIDKYNWPNGDALTNSVTNAIGSKFTGTALSELNPIATNISDETAKFFWGGTSSQTDREQRRNEVNVNATTGQAKKFVETQLDQLGSQTRTWNEQYKDVTGHYKENILTPNAIKAIQQMNDKYNLNIKISDITGNLADDDTNGASSNSPTSTTSSNTVSVSDFDY